MFRARAGAPHPGGGCAQFDELNVLSRARALEIPQRIDCGTASGLQSIQILARPEFLYQIDRMKIGYARVSTDDQNLDLQDRALRDAGAEKIFTDKASGAGASRPGLAAALSAVAAGDTLVVWRLDRLGRSLPHLISVVAELGDRGVGFQSLRDSLDTTSAQGRLVFHMMGALAEFERALISERTTAGVQAAKARGVRLGRRPTLNWAQVEHARALIAAGESPSAIARTFKVGRSTLYRALGSGAERDPGQVSNVRSQITQGFR